MSLSEPPNINNSTITTHLFLKSIQMFKIPSILLYICNITYFFNMLCVSAIFVLLQSKIIDIYISISFIYVCLCIIISGYARS